jgi:hypothetical protein
MSDVDVLIVEAVAAWCESRLAAERYEQARKAYRASKEREDEAYWAAADAWKIATGQSHWDFEGALIAEQQRHAHVCDQV